MAVTGLPEPDEKHAISMCRFAYQCVVKMQDVCNDLEGELGPGTEDLAMRVGLHSGSVTAGVLRGQKSRFQLFGDTVNTASRMESKGEKGRIQVSESTAELLIAGGKQHWIQKRSDKILAKGKGELQTYWLDPRKNTASNAGTSDTGDDDRTRDELLGYDSEPEKKIKKKIEQKKVKKPKTYETPRDTSEMEPITLANMKKRLASTSKSVVEEKYKRLIDWNTDVILKCLAKIVACRPGVTSSRRQKLVDHDNEEPVLPPAFESVVEVITLPPFNSRCRLVHKGIIAGMESLREDVHTLVSEIAALYNDIPFHNFEHASHVTLAANKLVSRMVASDDFTDTELYNLTYGISTDPLTQFGIIFSALIHDLGHPGVTNAQLVTEDDPVALEYRGRSVAEQNSVSVAWALLMQPRFQRIRECLYTTTTERKRFRQVLINAVMATDISDRSTLHEQQRKWNLAFRDFDDGGDADDMSSRFSQSGKDAKATAKKDLDNRRATVVIEHLIQIANIAHMMQVS